MEAFFAAKQSTSSVFRKATKEDMPECVALSTAIFGGVNIIPLEKRLAWLDKDELLAKDITPDDIEEFQPGKPLQVYIMAMGIKPRLSNLEKRTYAARLIKGLRDVITDMGTRGVTIATINARSEVPDGINILRHTGFTEIPSEVPGTRNFMIEVEKSGIPALKEYKRELAAWKERNEWMLLDKQHSEAGYLD